MRQGEFYHISDSYFQKFHIKTDSARIMHDVQPFFCALADKEDQNIFWCVPLPEVMGKKMSGKAEKNNNNLETKQISGRLGDVPLVYGTLRGREELVAAGEKSPNKNNNVVDSYLGELNLGVDFIQLGVFSKKFADGTLNKADLERLIHFKDSYFDQSTKYTERQMSAASPEANAELLTLLLEDKKVQNILREFSHTHEELFCAEDRKPVLENFNKLTREFFSIKTKLALEKTFERNGQIYFSLNEIVMDKEKNVDFNKLKDIFDEKNPNYHTVTSNELRFTFENYLNHPNLKFLLDKQVIEIPTDIKKEISEIIEQKNSCCSYYDSFWSQNMVPVTEEYNCGILMPNQPHILQNIDMKKRTVNCVKEAVKFLDEDPESFKYKEVLEIRTKLLRELNGEKSKCFGERPAVSSTDYKTLLAESGSQKNTQAAKVRPETLIQTVKKKNSQKKYSGSL